MHRGSRIALTAVSGGVLLLTGLVLLMIGAGINLAALDQGSSCVVEVWEGDDVSSTCHDDELTERVTAEVLEVHEVDFEEDDVPFGATHDVSVRYLSGDPVETDVYVLEGGVPPGEHDMVVVAFSPSEPEAYAALETELDRVHAATPVDDQGPDARPFVISGLVFAGLAAVAGVGGGFWSARGTPRPRPQFAQAWGNGYPPPGYGPPPGYAPPRYAPPAYPQPPGYPAQPGYGYPPAQPQPGYPPPGYPQPAAPQAEQPPGRPPGEAAPPPSGLTPPN